MGFFKIGSCLHPVYNTIPEIRNKCKYLIPCLTQTEIPDLTATPIPCILANLNQFPRVLYDLNHIVYSTSAGAIHFETTSLIQTKKIPWFPIVLMGKDYWKGVIEQMDVMEKLKTISPSDDQMLLITDDPDEAIGFLIDRIDQNTS